MRCTDYGKDHVHGADQLNPSRENQNIVQIQLDTHVELPRLQPGKLIDERTSGLIGEHLVVLEH
jgi:hypothetical protein